MIQLNAAFAKNLLEDIMAKRNESVPGKIIEQILPDTMLRYT